MSGFFPNEMRDFLIVTFRNISLTCVQACIDECVFGAQQFDSVKMIQKHQAGQHALFVKSGFVVKASLTV